MDMPKSAEEIRALLLSQHPDLKDDLAKISDLELLQCLICAYEYAIDIKQADLAEMERRLDDVARAPFYPVPH
ncbi:hypothetical protein NHF39_23170 [Pseudomonas proteolytica]|nr:hypothetical protein [Pseudomonas proteolytica]USW94208.1 hypothetical protein NHF39_23170 [Pseudomonas proteolytica]USX01822.1 hypothetical protein NHF41_08380 [Pseudomonas proteolytica]